VLDAILMEAQGVPAIAIVTAPFRETGEAMAASWGLPGYPFLDMPHPIANLTTEELDARADDLAKGVARWMEDGAGVRRPSAGASRATRRSPDP
jgi:hypothetical protein